MSRLAFDDILKPGFSLGSNGSRADAKNHTQSAQNDKSSSFDDTFKQAVDELRPKETPEREDEPDSAEREIKPSNRTAEKADADRDSAGQATGSDQKHDETDRNDSSISEDLESDADLLAEKNQEDSDDALVAQVVAAALQQEESSVLEDEDAASDTDTSLEIVDETDTSPLFVEDTSPSQDGTEEETSDTTTDEILLATSVGTTDSTATLMASSEAMVAPETNMSEEVAQTAVSTTAEASAAQNATTNAAEDNAASQISTGAETQANQGNTDQQDGADLGEEADSESGESEAATLENTQTAASDASTDDIEEKGGSVTDHQKTTTDAALKTDTPLERTATTLAGESKTGHATSSTATQPNSEPTLDTTDRVRFVERVAQAFSSQSSENGQIRMRLHPEELGSIKIEVTVRDGTMHARIETETREARNVLLDNLPALRERLATHNIKVEQFDIDYNAGGNQQGSSQSRDDWSDDFGQGGSNRAGGNRGNAREEPDSLDRPSASRAVSQIGSGEQLDVTI